MASFGCVIRPEPTLKHGMPGCAFSIPDTNSLKGTSANSALEGLTTSRGALSMLIALPQLLVGQGRAGKGGRRCPVTTSACYLITLLSQKQ